MSKSIEELKEAIVNWYDLCYKPLLPDQPTAVHWATKRLADTAREIKGEK